MFTVPEGKLDRCCYPNWCPSYWRGETATADKDGPPNTRAVAGPVLATRGMNLLENGILERFRWAQADDGLRLDLDRFAGLRVAAHASLAVRLDDAAESRNDELPALPLASFTASLKSSSKKRAAVFLGVPTFSAMCETTLVLLKGLAAI